MNEKLEQITAEGKTITVDGVDFKINALTTEDFLKAQTIGSNQSERHAVMHLMTASLEEEGISKDELREAPLSLTAAVVEAIEEVNNLEDFFDEDEMQGALGEQP